MKNAVSLQGSLDNLCGIYSIINIIKKLHNLKEKHVEEIFSKIIVELDDNEKRLSTIITQGLNSKELKSIFGLKIVEEKIERISSTRSETLDIFWDTLIEQSEKENRAILLGISGKHDHWTVVDKVTEKRITLLDSDNIQYINKSNCAIKGHNDNQALHILHPAQTYFFCKK
ncbi:hypothetical protein [Methylophilus sp. 3sh_L]|uniref:hypothetical protein n=1 Tax=Methylophilus sp. 3sh_L TaxID=3377114 RepID=UPI00398F5BF5